MPWNACCGNPHVEQRVMSFVFVDLQFPGHASGWESPTGQQDCHWPELPGTSPECTQGKNVLIFVCSNTAFSHDLVLFPQLMVTVITWTLSLYSLFFYLLLFPSSALAEPIAPPSGSTPVSTPGSGSPRPVVPGLLRRCLELSIFLFHCCNCFFIWISHHVLVLLHMAKWPIFSLWKDIINTNIKWYFFHHVDCDWLW